ncbi:MAG: helix-turn-helix transcriptional regulator [Erysipelotrichales bacterium]|nr:helix-turn-helix transcriptional regulator [Erysipelotrichales bacterium]
MNIEFANRLVELRKRENLSQEELADKLSISRQAVSKWERGEASPDTDNLIALARIYQISLDELVNIKINSEEAKIAEDSVVAFKPLNNEFIAESKHPKELDPIMNDEDDEDEEDFFDEDFFEDEKQPLPPVRKSSIWVSFPVIPLAVLVFLFMGIAFDAWHPAWLVFLVFPLVHSVFLIKEKRSHLTLISVTMTILFLILGIAFDAWHPAWLLFLMIPVISTFLRIRRRKRIKDLNRVVPIIIFIIYILLGTYFDIWHPAWLIFLSIPIIHWFIETLEKRKY